MVGEAGSVAEAVPLVKELDPDVVLLDVHLPDGGGQAVIAAVALERPGVRFLALSVSDAPEDVIAVIRAGARGYVTKTISAEELATPSTACGRRRRLLAAARRLRARRVPRGRAHPDAELEQLTPREREVLRLIARGYPTRRSRRGCTSRSKTVESHVSAVLRKLQLSSGTSSRAGRADRRLV